MLLILTLQDDVATDNDAVTSDSHQRLSSAAINHQNESVSLTAVVKKVLSNIVSLLLILFLWLLLVHIEIVWMLNSVSIGWFV